MDTNGCNKKRCLVGILLFLSIGLNLFLAGVLVGRPDHGPRMKGPMNMMGEQIGRLSPEHRDKAQAILEDYKPKFRTQMKEVSKTRKELDALLRSDHYSREAVQAKFDELSDDYRTLHRTGQQMMLDLADELPAHERAKLMPKQGWKKPEAR